MLDEIRDLLGSVLQIPEKRMDMDENTVLLGNLPELDSMAVVTVITSLEDHYGIMVDDDEISAEIFNTLGSLTRFVEQKLKSTG